MRFCLSLFIILNIFTAVSRYLFFPSSHISTNLQISHFILPISTSCSSIYKSIYKEIVLLLNKSPSLPHQDEDSTSQRLGLRTAVFRYLRSRNSFQGLGIGSSQAHSSQPTSPRQILYSRKTLHLHHAYPHPRSRWCRDSPVG